MFCKYCGKPIDENTMRCRICGRPAGPMSGGNGFWDLMGKARDPEKSDSVPAAPASGTPEQSAPAPINPGNGEELKKLRAQIGQLQEELAIQSSQRKSPVSMAVVLLGLLSLVLCIFLLFQLRNVSGEIQRLKNELAARQQISASEERGPEEAPAPEPDPEQALPPASEGGIGDLYPANPPETGGENDGESGSESNTASGSDSENGSEVGGENEVGGETEAGGEAEQPPEVNPKPDGVPPLLADQSVWVGRGELEGAKLVQETERFDGPYKGKNDDRGQSISLGELGQSEKTIFTAHYLSKPEPGHKIQYFWVRVTEEGGKLVFTPIHGNKMNGYVFSIPKIPGELSALSIKNEVTAGHLGWYAFVALDQSESIAYVSEILELYSTDLIPPEATPPTDSFIRGG